jgi:predicted porin
MNNTLWLPSAAGLALLLTSLLAQAQQVTLYGQIRLTANEVKTGSNSIKELRDNASRLGFRGSENLGRGLTALFGLEFGFGADTGALGTPAYRHSYVGLRSGLGTVALGRLDSGNPTGSPIYSQIIALTAFAPNDAGATATSNAMQNARNRTSDSFGYLSPKFGPFDVRARFYFRGAGTAAEPENAAKSLDLGLNYAAGPLRAGLGYAKDTRWGGLLANEFDDKWQLGVRYEFGGFSPYALYGVDRYNNRATTRRDVKYWVLGARASTGPHAVVLNRMEREVQSNRIGQRERWQLAYTYKLSNRTELQSFIDRDGIDSSRSNVAVRAIGAGIRHDF